MNTQPLARTAPAFVLALFSTLGAAQAAPRPTEAPQPVAEPAPAAAAPAEPTPPAAPAEPTPAVPPEAAPEPAPTAPEEAAPALPDETAPGELPDEAPPPDEAAPPAVAPPPAEATTPPEDGLYYPEEADGESSLTLGDGVVGWFTDRGPLADLALLAPIVGYDHRIGPARLGWRLQVALDPTGDESLVFVYADLLSVEYVFAEDTLRPYTRLAIGFGLDLADADVEIDGKNPGLGDDGYFNEDNGPTGGPGLTLGAGVDAFLSAGTFLRVEAFARGYGGVGRASAMWGATLALGFVL